MGISIEPPGPADPVAATPSLLQFGTSLGPAAGVNIASLVAPPPGVYEIELYSELSGTCAAADQDNLNLVINAVQITRLPLSAVITSGDVQPMLRFLQRVAAGNISIQARALATATAQYTCLIVATLVG